MYEYYQLISLSVVAFVPSALRQRGTLLYARHVTHSLRLTTTYPQRTLSSPQHSMLSAAVATLSLAGNPSLKLNNGVMMPQLAAGTWQYSNATAKDSIAKAVAAGFTHIDTAENYGNQIGVGQELAALFAAGTVKRSDLFITTKTLPCDSGKLTHAECMAQVCLFLFLILSLSQPFFISPWLTTAPSSCLRRSVTLRATSPISDLTTST